MLDAFPERIAVLDERGIIVSVNDAWRSAAHANALQARDAGVGASYLAVCERAGDREPVAREVGSALRDMLAGRRTQPFETRYVWSSAAGHQTFMVRLLRAPDPPLRLLVVHQDVTHWVRALEDASATLRQTQEEVTRTSLSWRETFDAFDDLVVVVDERLRVLEMNARAALVAGLSPDSAHGLDVERLARERGSELWVAVGRLAASCIESGLTLSRELDEPTTERTWTVTASPIASGAPDVERRSVVLVRDVTALTELQRAAQRDETLSAMGALVAGVAHEVRNPLFAISSTLDAFEAEVGEGGPHTEYMRVLRAEVTRMSELMSDLLDYGRTPPLQLAPVAPSEAVQHALASCTSLLRSTEVTVRIEVGRGDTRVMGDAKRLVQIFHNLLENAIQHSPPGAEVVVQIHEHMQDELPWIDCVVLDRGPGFRPEDIRRLFDPFFTRRRGGTGLGLAIVQRIAYEHGGDVKAATRAGGGALVLVRLPSLSRHRSRRLP